ncbi:SDR family NAD(P)-dependent oxidoreductase [Nocardia rhamnosiphila]
MTTQGGGRVAIVTGAAGGIGSAIVERLIGAGYRVAAVDIDTAGLAALVERIASTALSTFVFDTAGDATRGVEDIVAELGSVHALVNNAGVLHPGDALATSDSDWAYVMHGSLTGTFQMSRAVLPCLLAQGAGAIVNIGSVAAVVGLKNRVAYCAAKAGVLGLTRAMAADHAAAGIRINAVNPGTTETAMVAAVIAGSADPEATRAIWSTRQPVGRMGRPAEIAAAVSFLVSDEAGYMSGSVITVDGGLSAV